jgi:hypothetical protein
MPRLQASTGQAREAENLPSQTGQPPVSARGLRSRAALVRAARAVFERDGFLEARIVDICAEAGIVAQLLNAPFQRLPRVGLSAPTSCVPGSLGRVSITWVNEWTAVAEAHAAVPYTACSQTAGGVVVFQMCAVPRRELRVSAQVQE